MRVTGASAGWGWGWGGGRQRSGNVPVCTSGGMHSLKLLPLFAPTYWGKVPLRKCCFCPLTSLPCQRRHVSHKAVPKAVKFEGGAEYGQTNGKATGNARTLGGHYTGIGASGGCSEDAAQNLLPRFPQ